ncbi:MAG: sigma 54-interacting transcriptional regulator [Bacillota bacterium]
MHLELLDEELIEKILQKFTSGLVILNDHEEVIWADRLAEKICGNTEIINKKYADVFSISLSKILNQPQIITSLSGQKFRLAAASYPCSKREYTIVSIEEITDLKSAETRLFCLEKILEAINDGIIVSDYEGRIALYNKSQEKLEDMASQDMVGKYLWDAYNYNEELSEHRGVYKKGIPIINRYRAHAYKDGIPKYLSYSTYPIEKDGEIIAVFSISKNETKLQSLLAETIELKRQLISQGEVNGRPVSGNGTKYTFADIVCESAVMQNLIKEAEMISTLDTTVLISGETGTGKEVFAQSIHNFSKNQNEPFIAINCAAIPETLLESILFGTTKGAYTGAVDQKGLFEEARGGTLFLDEINSMPLTLQPKLLRVLQERNVRRVGGLKVNPIHCRVICAANEDPRQLVSTGALRQDLFYRIAGICMHIPPLRERVEDIVCLTKYFIRKYNKQLNKQIKGCSKNLEDSMLKYNWPGNVRELEHLIQNLMIRANDKQVYLNLENIPHYLREMIVPNNSIEVQEAYRKSLPAMLHDAERKMILQVLEKNRWNLTKSAQEMGIIRQSLQSRMKKLGIKRKK